MSKRKVTTYDKEFKENAGNLYLKSNKSYDAIGDELGIPGAALASWVGAKKRWYRSFSWERPVKTI